MNKVFIIEDDVKINEQLGSFLKRYGYEVATSFDFENIVDIALEENPKIILLDINLPVFDGYYICKEMLQVIYYEQYNLYLNLYILLSLY